MKLLFPRNPGLVPTVLLLALTACQRPAQFSGGGLLAQSRQQLLVMVEQERDSTGWLYRYAREGNDWHPIGSPMRVTVGAGGVGKVREGDRRAPTGASPATTVFGYGSVAPGGQ